MTLPSDNKQLRTAFFHAASQKAHTRGGQAVFESKMPSLGVVPGEYVLTQLSECPYAADEATIDAWIVANPGILKKWDKYSLTAEPTSNGEAWFIESASERQRFIIPEYLMINPATGQISNGYVVKLWREDNTQISPTQGQWFYQPDEGLVICESGSTPVDMGWGNIKITCYTYIGRTIASTIEDINIEKIEAAENLSGHRIVTTDANGKAIYMDNTILSQMNKFKGITTQSILVGETGTIKKYGSVENLGWTFDTNIPVFLGLTGTLVQAAPVTGYSFIVGFPETSTILNIRPQKPIKIL